MALQVLVCTLYLAAGLAAVVVLRLRGPGGLAMVVLWPFLLPPRLLSEAPVAMEPSAQAVDRARAALQALAAPPESCARILAELEASLARRALRRRELEAALASAPPGIQPRLQEILRTEVGALEAGHAVADELTAQLTLLRFVGPAALADEAAMEGMEALLARIQAQLSLE